MAVFTLVAFACSSDGDQGVVTDLSAALDGASAGDVIRLAPGTYDGSLSIPAGVELRGAGPGPSIIVAPDNGTSLFVTGGTTEQPTVLANLELQVVGGFGLVVATGAALNVSDVQVRVERGVGLAFEGLDALILDNVNVIGPVNAANAASMPADPTAADSATHGLVLVRVSDARLTDVDVSGFAQFGALFVMSTVDWQRGVVDNVLSQGVMAHASDVRIAEVQIRDILQGTRIAPAYGLVATGESTVSSDSLSTTSVEGVGLFVAGASGSHANLTSMGNQQPGVWLQDADNVRFSGIGTALDDNGRAGIVALRSSGIEIADASVTATRTVPSITGTVGDGIQLVESSNGIVLRDLALDGNERAGLVLDLSGGSTSTLTLSGIDVTGTGTQLGAIAQNGDIVPGWDDGIMRLGVTGANDAAIIGDLDVLVAVSDLPQADEVASTGISLFGAISPTE